MKYFNNKICYLSFEEHNKICEEGVTYIYESGRIIHNKHDISIRNILTDKKEATIFINDTLNLKNTKDEVNEEDIDLYNNRYITQNFSNREADVIYKLKSKDIFFLIEHQSTVDYNMPRRIVEYKIGIIMQYIDENKKRRKNYKTPLVNSIVLYTGEAKWDVSKTIEESQVKMEEKEVESFGSYKTIDTNNYSQKELLEKEGALYKVILIDRARTKEESEKLYKQVIKSKLSEEERQKINLYANNILMKVIGKQRLDKINEKYKKDKGVENMLAETLKREIRKDKRLARKEGIIDGQRKVAREMLKSNVNIELIKQWTKLPDKEIEKIKKTL